MSASEKEIKYKIILLGDSSVGKTCIFKKITTGQYNEKSISTIGMDRRTLLFDINTNKEGEPEKKENCEIQLWDTAGQERFRSITKTYYSSSHGLLFIYDLTKRETFDNLDEWINGVKESLGSENSYLIFLIGNKLDLVEENPDKREVTTEEGENKCKENGIIWGGECSAKSYTEEKFKEMFQKYSELIFQKVGYVSNKGEVVKNNNGEKIKKKSKC